MTTPKVELTDPFLKNLKPAEPGKRYEIADTHVNGLRVRVGDEPIRESTNRRRIGKAAQISFVLLARFPPSTNPTRRTLGAFPAMCLADAREKAIGWKEDIRRGVDPAERQRDERESAERLEAEAEAERIAAEEAEAARRANTFEAAAETYLRTVVIGPETGIPIRKRELSPLQRNGPDVERAFRNVLIPRWGDRPITDIESTDIRALVNEKIAEGKKWRAHSLLSFLSAFFNWTLEDDDDGNPQPYGVTVNPCAKINRKKAIGKKKARDRVLSDAELPVFWAAAGKLGYPFGDLYRVLALTGARLNEVAEASWSELDPALLGYIRATQAKGERFQWATVPDAARTLIVPPERMKGTNEEADAHAIPLSDAVLDIIATLPVGADGDFMFSTTLGKLAVAGFSKAKAALDAKMLELMREAAKEAGGDPVRVELRPFVIHDLRRTCRTGLSKIKVQTEIAELVLAHAQTGILKVYNCYDYLDEKRDALARWADHLIAIVTPPDQPADAGGKVIPMPRRAHA